MMPTTLLQRLIDRGAKIIGVANDSRQVCPGDLFLAYPGEHSDGRRFIDEAIARGAVAVLWEPEGFEWAVDCRIPNEAVVGLKRQASSIAATVYENPSKKLTVIGVTGTNGKTSTTQWIAAAAECLGSSSAVIGTLGFGRPGRLVAGKLTTPDPVTLQRTLATMVRDGVTHLAMEVSSIGVEEGRVDDVDFDVAVLTNLSRDHLDYHASMDVYRAAKEKLFIWPSLKTAVLNLDDPFGRHLVDHCRDGVERMGYGSSLALVARSEGWTFPCLCIESLEPLENGQRLTFAFGDARRQIETALVGDFNAENLLAVAATLIACGFDFDKIVEVLPKLRPVAGRMERVDNSGEDSQPLIVVDYAHTPDALEKAIRALRPVTAVRGGALWVVFGCGGDRDAGKRPLMGKVAGSLADRIIVTDDNPRSENPESIRQAIVAGMDAGYPVEIVADREKAIDFAVAAAQPADVILIAGKGHEDYQEFADVRLTFSDRTAAKAAMAERLKS